MLYDATVIGGTERVGVALANALTDFYNVYLYSIMKSNGEIPYFIKPNVNYFNGKIVAPSLKYVPFKCFRSVNKYLSDNAIETVLLVGSMAGGAVGILSPFLKSKIIFCEHTSLMSQWSDKKSIAVRRICCQTCNHIVVLTEDTMNSYVEKLHIAPRKVSYIYNWIDQSKTGNIIYNSTSKKIISIGRLSKEKGYDMLLEVAKDVLHKHLDWEWHIFGDGDCFEEIKETIEKENLQEQIILRGNIANASEYLNQYSFLVLTSYREGLPLVLLEAKQYKLPCISFDVVTGPSEIIQNEKNGYLIPPYNIALMIEAVEILISSVDKRKKFSDNAWLDIDKFSKDKILQKWINLIDSK